MDRHKVINSSGSGELFESIRKMHEAFDDAFRSEHDRSLPLADELLDRWERARRLGFGTGSSIYDSSYVFGKVTVGVQTWIGPFTIVDGSGGLSIGDHCTISAGVHIYTHDNIARTLTAGISPIERTPVRIGNQTYIGPNAIIAKGVTIGDCCIIGASTFVNSDVPSHSVMLGTPGRVAGKVTVRDGKVSVEYFKAG